MEIKKLNDDFMQRIVDEDAWKDLSGELSWSESLLEKYKDKVAGYNGYGLVNRIGLYPAAEDIGAALMAYAAEGVDEYDHDGCGLDTARGGAG